MTTASHTIPTPLDARERGQKLFFWTNMVFLCGTMGLGLLRLVTL